MISKIEEVIIKTFQDYLENIESLTEANPQGFFLFRGQTADVPLIPKIGRFKSVKNIEKFEKDLLDDFRKRAQPYFKRPLINEWDLLALAQHYGLPTRLLDWSENPLVALWFATEKKVDNTKFGVVWMFDPLEEDIQSLEESSPFTGIRTKVFCPNHIAERITAQSGWFSCHKISSKKQFVPFEKITLYQHSLEKIYIPVKLFSEIRVKLNSMGVNASTIFPDLEGLSRHLTWKHLKEEDFNR
jgi:hypothetical protein